MIRRKHSSDQDGSCQVLGQQMNQPDHNPMQYSFYQSLNHSQYLPWLNQSQGQFDTASLRLRENTKKQQTRNEATSKPLRSHFEPMICLTPVYQLFDNL